MTSTFIIDIASVPDREEPVAEVWYGDEQVAELRREGAELRLQIFSTPSSAAWDFSIDAFLSAIHEAMARL